mmetsp:Transcript_12226/g.28489  ORF Transcript_12226/g.28489 Transcript_12226/m.28489 type:complete len:586 (+) Transcript_12226:86-1843(+)
MALEEFLLLCCNGHEIRKYKRLKPWQHVLSSVNCSICGRLIDRNEYRWRCEEHCPYDVCTQCYDKHWLKVFAQANGLEDLDQRRRILSLVPEKPRAFPEFKEATDGLKKARAERARLEGESSSPNNDSRWRLWDNSSLPDKMQPLLGASTGKIVPEAKEMLQAILWIIVWCLTAPLVGTLLAELVISEEAAFPYPLLGVGLAGFGAAALSWIVLAIRGEASEAFELLTSTKELQMQVGIIGLLLGVEAAIAAFMFTEARGVQVTMYMLTPVLTLLAVTLALGKRWPPATLLFSTTLAAGSGLLTNLQEPSYWWLIKTPFALVTDVLITVRWVLLQFLLQVKDRVTRPPATMSPLVFTAACLPTAATVAAEATVLFERSGLVALVHLQHPEQVVMLLVAMSVSCFLMILSEMQIIQLTSATSMSMLLPVVRVGTTMAVAFAKQSIPPITCFVAVGTYLVSAVIYYKSAPMSPSVDEGAGTNGAPRSRLMRSNTNTPMFPSSLAGWGLSRAGTENLHEPLMRQQSTWRERVPVGPGVAPLFTPPPPKPISSAGVAPLAPGDSGASSSARRPPPWQARRDAGVAALGN